MLVVLVVLAGCSPPNVHVRYPAQADFPTGTLVLKLTEAAEGVTVAINGVLVVDDAHTKRVQIDGVPVGTREIVIAANGADKAFNVWIDSERPTTVPLGVPAEGSSFLKTLAGSLLTILVYSLLH